MKNKILITIILFVFSNLFGCMSIPERKATGFDGKIVIQSGHTDEVLCVAYSHNGKFMLTAGKDNFIRIWNNRGKLVRQIKTRFWVSHMAISRDDQEIFAGEMNQYAYVYNFNGKLLRTLGKFDRYIRSVAISPNGDIYALGFHDGWGALYNRQGKPIKYFKDPHSKDYDLYTIKFLENGDYLTGYADGYIRIWKANGVLYKRIKTPDKSVNTLTLSPKKNRFASAGIFSISNDEKSGYEAGKIKLCIWDIQGHLIHQFKIHSSQSISYTPDGNKLIVAEKYTKHVSIYTKNGKLLSRFRTGRYMRQSPANMALSPNGHFILTANQIGNPAGVYVWNLKGERVYGLGPLGGMIEDAKYSPDGKLFVTGDSDGNIRLWTAQGYLLNVFKAENEAVSQVAFSPNGRYIVSAADNIKLWDLNGKKLGTLPGHKNGIDAITFSPDGRYLFSGGGDGYVDIFDLKENTYRRLHAHNNRVNSIAVHPSGKYFATGSFMNFKIWDMNGHVLASDIDGNGRRKYPLGEVFALAFSPNGRVLATRSATKQTDIQMFDLKGNFLDGVKLWQRNLNTGDVRFSPDGRWLASTSSNDIVVWNTKKLTTHRVFKGHTDTVVSLDFSPDGKYLLSASRDAYTIIWNVKSGASIRAISKGRDWLIYTPDGYFDASHYGGRMVGLVKNDNVYAIDQFAVYYNRPDLIYKRMGFGNTETINYFKKEYLKRLEELNIDKSDLRGSLDVPKVKIHSTRQNGEYFYINFSVEDAHNLQNSYQIYVNDVPVYQIGGKPLSGNDTIKERILLSSGVNKIEISAFNKAGAESYRAQVNATYHGPKKGNLYYVGFGVSKYKDKRLNLNYAHKDVLDLADVMRRYKSEFKHIYIHTYINKDATVSNIKRLDDILKNAGVDDTVVIFFSGHGGYDFSSAVNYYYATYGINVNDIPDTAISFENIESLMRKIKSRKKLLLLDTCDSGEMDPDSKAKAISMVKKLGIESRMRNAIARKTTDLKHGVTIFRNDNRYIYNDLRRRSGTVVFSASRAGELSFESKKLKNGLFTHELIAALKDRHTDVNGDGLIALDELRASVTRKVVNDTQGFQVPTVDRDNIFQQIYFPVIR